MRKRSRAVVEASGDQQEVWVVLEPFMNDHRPFLRNHYSLYQLCEESGIPLAPLADLIEKRYTSFDNFLNVYRIDYCRRLLDRIPSGTVELFDLTIICGFTDEREFCRVFRKITHMPVKEYIRRIGPGNDARHRFGAGRFFVLLLVAIAGLHIAKYDLHLRTINKHENGFTGEARGFRWNREHSQFARMGLTQKGFDTSKLLPEQRNGLLRALQDAPSAAQGAFAITSQHRNGWR